MTYIGITILAYFLTDTLNWRMEGEIFVRQLFEKLKSKVSRTNKLKVKYIALSFKRTKTRKEEPEKNWKL